MALPLLKPTPPSPLRPGDRITMEYRDTGLYPKRFTGVMEKIFPKFAVVRTSAGYRVTVHVTDFGLIRKAGGVW
ncbi:MAG: hypothetical protein K6U74_12580 [Firmicutes bacterium]|nr:hypothetical protein [Bacillota bacterium]